MVTQRVVQRVDPPEYERRLQGSYRAQLLDGKTVAFARRYAQALMFAMLMQSLLCIGKSPDFHCFRRIPA